MSAVVCLSGAVCAHGKRDPRAQESAEAFQNAYAECPLVLHGSEVRLNWAKSSPLAPELLPLIQQGATRCLFVGGLRSSATEEQLCSQFAAFGEFDSAVVMQTKGYAFVNMTSIRSAVCAKNALDGRELQGRHCAWPPALGAGSACVLCLCLCIYSLLFVCVFALRGADRIAWRGRGVWADTYRHLQPSPQN